jgi:hypothetical protein
MLFSVAFITTDVSEERIASIIRVNRIDELGKTLPVTSNRSTLLFLRSMLRLLITVNFPSSPIPVTPMMEAVRSSETSLLKRVTRSNIPEDGFLHCHRRENLNYSTALTGWDLSLRCNVSPVRYKLDSYIP